MDGEDIQVSVVVGSLVGSTTDEILIPLGANAAGQMAVAYFFNTTGGSAVNLVRIYTVTSWALAGATQRDQDTASYTTGDTLAFRRIGNVYTPLKNGSPISGSSSTDGGNRHPPRLQPPNLRVRKQPCWQQLSPHRLLVGGENQRGLQ